MRIDSSGRLLAGTTSVGARLAHTLARTGSFATEVVQQQTSSGASVAIQQTGDLPLGNEAICIHGKTQKVSVNCLSIFEIVWVKVIQGLI
jgi:hypothetical protein